MAKRQGALVYSRDKMTIMADCIAATVWTLGLTGDGCRPGWSILRGGI